MGDDQQKFVCLGVGYRLDSTVISLAPKQTNNGNVYY